MDNKKEKSVFNKNWLWLILIVLLLLLAGIIIFVYPTIKIDQEKGTTQISGEDGSAIEKTAPPTIGSFNINDPSPVYKDSAFTFSLINDFPSYKKSYYIDGAEICSGAEKCISKISKLGKHTLKICFDDLSLCDTININVLSTIENPIKRTESKTSGSDVKDKDVKSLVTTSNSLKDTDGDGMDDKNDACPTRKGSNSNFGCPKVNLKGTRNLNTGERIKLMIEYDDSRPNDQINWNSLNDLVFSSKNGKEVEISSNIVGKYRINYNIYNSKDGFVMENSDIFHVKVSNKNLEKELMNLAEYGNNKILKIKEIEEKKAESELLLKKWINGNISVSKSGGASKPKYDNFINELLSVKRSSETHIRSITISDISYEENSGKINFFIYKLN